MKDLNEILIFTSVAQHGSFSKAAKSLDIPISTVSRKVSDLEARLGVTLITRTTRKLSLTRNGTQYYQQCADLFSGLEAAEAQVTQLQENPEGFLRVSIPVGMSSGRFTDFISQFLKKYPRIQIDLLISNHFVDLVSEGVDLAIRFGNLDNSSLIARRLGTTTSLLVASPDYLKKHGAPKQPQDLKKHQCIVYRTKTNEPVWELVKEKNRQKVEVSGQISATDLVAIKEFTLKGHGISWLPEMYSLDALNDGSLQQVLPDWIAQPSPANAVYLSRRFLPTRLEIFLKELSEWENPVWTR